MDTRGPVKSGRCPHFRGSLQALNNYRGPLTSGVLVYIDPAAMHGAYLSTSRHETAKFLTDISAYW